jgi:isopentenyl-diphosphate delta-isomerase
LFWFISIVAIFILDIVMKEEVIVVDTNDKQIGTAEKLAAHQNGGQLHRAFSIFVFNNDWEIMLQRRAMEKYHCPGLWTNTCCSHPRPGETILAAATRRLQEEMGFVCPLEEKFSFIYRAEFSNGLTEHEFDHVFVGQYNKDPQLNLTEAMDYKRITVDDLLAMIKENPENITVWTKIIMWEYLDKLLYNNINI